MTSLAELASRRASTLVEAQLPDYTWQTYQEPPAEWSKDRQRWWNLQWGRGCGKTQTASRIVAEHVTFDPPCIPDQPYGHKLVIVTPKKASELKNTIVHGKSGLASQLRSVRMLDDEIRIPGTLVVTVSMYSEQTVEDARGPASNCCMVWIEEPGSGRWFKDAFDLVSAALREGRQLGMITGTPKRTPQYRKVIGSPEVVTTRAETNENELADPDWIRSLYRQYAGTALEAQELRGELVKDAPGALWKTDQIDLGRIDFGTPLPEPVGFYLGVDPGEHNETTGAVVQAKYRNCPVCPRQSGPHLVVADAVDEIGGDWLDPVIGAYNHWRDYGRVVVVSESNYKGDEVRSTLLAADPTMTFIPVRASAAKAVRARPFATMYRPTENDPLGRVHHYGTLDALEAEQTLWVPSDRAAWSPHHLDAAVHAATHAAGLTVDRGRWFLG